MQRQKALILPALIAVTLAYIIHLSGGFKPVSQVGAMFGICGVCIGYIIAKAGV